MVCAPDQFIVEQYGRALTLLMLAMIVSKAVPKGLVSKIQGFLQETRFCDGGVVSRHFAN
jgi:hypothetical protein